MSKDKIKTIKLNNFRGATKPLQLDFDPKKSMTLIFGENGTGKSTIIDALDFVFNKECGSLKEKSSTNIKSHLPALGTRSIDVKVAIETQAGKSWIGKLKGLKPEIKENNDLFSVGILRRDKILKLINAQPSKRYEALKNFIELPNIRSSESSLRDIIRHIEKDLSNNIKSKTDQEEILKEACEKEGKDKENFLEWAKEMSKQKDEELKEKISKYEKFIDLIKKSIEDWEALEKLSIQFAESAKTLKIAKNDLEALNKNNQPEELVGILQKTQSFLQKQNTAKECPACEQSIELEKLQKRIQERLKTMKEYIEKNKKYMKINEGYEFINKTLIQKKKMLSELIKSLIKYSKQASMLDFEKESKQIVENFDKNDFLDSNSFQTEKAKIFFEQAKSLFQQLQNDRENNQKKLNQLNLIKTSFSSLKKIDKKIKQQTQKKEYLSKVLEIVETQRKTYIENILNNISEDVQGLYTKLHPKEGLGNIKLYLKPRVPGSLEIKSHFQNKADVPPQAYYSESHLDTLGIAVFIAMAKYFKNDIIVLDDVVTSLDQQHLNRFIKMLHEESQNFNQIILTTHYRPWREKYKFHRQPNSNIQLIELSTFWSLEQGIKSSQTKLFVKELEGLKNQEPFDRQNASSKAGIFLESLLDSLSLLYELRVPRRPEPKYTLGELLSCFSKKFINNMNIEYNSHKKPLSEIMHKLSQIAEPIRNQVGAHFNISGMDISDKEVKSLLDTTIELGKMLICPQCNGLPERKKPDHWACNCEQTYLYPLQK